MDDKSIQELASKMVNVTKGLCQPHNARTLSFSGVQGGLAFSGPGNYTEVLLERSHVRVGASPLFCWRKERRLHRTACGRFLESRIAAAPEIRLSRLVELNATGKGS
jgi:hypothetical protein